MTCRRTLNVRISSTFVLFLAVITVLIPFPGPAQQAATAQPLAKSAAVPAPANQPTMLDNYGKLPLSFEANHGQADAQVKFLSRTSGYSLFLTGDEAVLTFCGSKPNTHLAKIAGADRALVPGSTAPKGGVLRMKLRNANPAAKAAGVDELPGTRNYFIGNDPTKWRTSVPTYAKVKYEGIYSGVDLVYYGNQRQLEYDFIVAPGANPQAIRLRIEGAKRLRREHGDVVMMTAAGDVHLRYPRLYQDEDGNRHEVAGEYVIEGKNEVRFRVGSYNRSKPLVIDPVLAYSTYVNEDLGAYGIALDPARNAYVVGLTSINGRDAVITKINADGSSVLYTTYLGGTLDEWAPAIAVDSAGSAYLTGTTHSTDFPTKNAIQSTNHGAYDAFVTKLSPDGSGLVYSTYLGGSVDDYGDSIAVDNAGNAYVAGGTGSTDFPTSNALQPVALGQGDGFVAKINASGSAFVYSTYLTGTGFDYASGVVADSSGNAYVTGATESTDFPTANPLQPYHGGRDAFVSKINASGSAFVYSTFLGGSGEEDTGAIALDSGRNVYVVGSTTSSDFPTKNPIQATNAGGWDVFVAKINAGGNALLYSTYLGGSGNDRAYTPEIGGGSGAGIGVDSAGNVYITGLTESHDFPVYNAIQSTFAGGSDTFIAGISAAGDAYVYSTYFGALGAESGAGLAVDSRGSVYVAGTTGGPLPITPAAADRAYLNGGGFLVKIALNTFVSGLPAKASLETQLVGTTGPPKNFVLQNNGTTPLTINRVYVMGANASDFTQTNTCGDAIAAGAKCTIAVSFSPSALNLRQAVLVVSDSDPASPQAGGLAAYGTIVSFLPTTLSFGNRSVGTSVSQSVTLTNTAKVALKITSISVTEANPGDFSQTNNCGTGIPASGQCTIAVTFGPTATGRRTAAVAVNDNGGGSPQGLTLTGTGISATATTAALVSNLNPSTYGQKVTLTATVRTSGSIPPTGTVNFTWGGYSIGGATLNASGVATLYRSNLNVYTYPLTAVYLGDTNNGPSASPILNQVVKETTSAATLTASPNPSTQGQIVTFTATITSPTVTPTGPVTFTAGTTVLGTAQLSNHKATFTTSTLPVGSTTVKATYAGNSNVAGSSASVTHMVQP